MTGFATSVPYEELDLSPFEALPRPCWSPELFLADELIAAVVTRRCETIRAAIGDAGEVAAARRGAFDWVERRLALGGCPWSDEALGEAVASAAPGLGSTFELIDLAADAYPAFLRGEVDGASVLFGRDALALWERYFDEENLSYDAVNRLAAFAADEATAGASELRALEVGGGCGSGALALLDRLGGRIAGYRFTEPFPSFLRRGRERIAERFAGAPVTFGRADLNLPLARQGIEPASLDLVFAVNTLHVARDLVTALSALREALAPGGRLVLGEGVRPRPGWPVPIELVFGLMPQFDDVKVEPFRPTGGFLDAAGWREALRRAGFARVRFVPDMDAAVRVYPTYSMAAIIAEQARPEGSEPRRS